MGDPCGISPELTARLLADRDIGKHTRLLVIGDSRVLAMGANDAALTIDLPDAQNRPDDAPGHSLLDLGHLDPRQIQRGVVSLDGGRFALQNFMHALTLAASHKVQAVCFTPFNKQAMRLARPGYDDEIGVVTEVLQARQDGREFNILENLWNARVTSHIPLKDVAAALSVDRIADAGVLADRCMREAGFKIPRIAVAALNPHAGDGGAFGREEIDLITPAIESMRARDVLAHGPVPADTVFVRAKRGEFDAVLTMFHDQGQIAMKLMGFDRGVTYLGGYGIPILTPAHGTAYDIAGQGIADVKASCNAVLLAARMAARNRSNESLPTHE